MLKMMFLLCENNYLPIFNTKVNTWKFYLGTFKFYLIHNTVK